MARHGGLISSNGASGWYQTEEEDEVIEFDYVVNSILVETLDDTLTIQLNGDKDNKEYENLWVISANDKEGIDGLSIKKMMIHGAAGQTIRWKALIK